MHPINLQGLAQTYVDKNLNRMFDAMVMVHVTCEVCLYADFKH
jgi:hypothetical protein